MWNATLEKHHPVCTAYGFDEESDSHLAYLPAFLIRSFRAA